MIKAIWRAAAPGRFAMFMSVFAIVILARLGGAISQGDRWVGSESQMTIAIVVLWLTLPVFVSMLATPLLRGEHAPLAWSLARPIPRTRLLGSIVVLDLLTIAACMLAAWVVLEGFGDTTSLLGGRSSGLSPLVVAVGYAPLYMLAAIAGSRTSSAVRASGTAALIVATAAVALTSATSLLTHNALTALGLHERWASLYLWEGLRGWGGIGALTQAHTWWLLSGLLLATAAIGGLLLAFIRAAQLVPGPVRWSQLLMPGVGLLGISTLLFVAGSSQAYLAAPPQAKRGDIELLVTVHVVDPNLTLRSVKLRFDGKPFSRTLEHDASPPRGRGAWSVVALSAGHYDACASVQRNNLPADAAPELRFFEHCVPVVVTPHPRQTLSLDVAMANDAPHL